MINVAARNNVQVLGEGERTIMFGHGFGCDQSMWQYIAPSFAKKFKVVLYDYVGSGHSDVTAYSSDKYRSFQGYVQDVLDIAEELKLTRIIYVGHSVSSMIGMLASRQRPELFEQLIMIGPSPRYLNDGDYFGGFEPGDIQELLEMMEMNFSGWASFLAPLAMNAPDRPVLSEELERSFISNDPVIAREFAEMTFMSDHRKELPKVTVPSLIMQCSEDSIVPLGVGHYLKLHLKGSELKIMEAKGHYPHISHPEETIQVISDYLGVKLD